MRSFVKISLFGLFGQLIQTFVCVRACAITSKINAAFIYKLGKLPVTLIDTTRSRNRNRISLECHGFTGHWLQSQGALCSLRAATPILGACYLVSCANVPHAVCLAVPAEHPTPRSPACAGIAARAL